MLSKNEEFLVDRTPDCENHSIDKKEQDWEQHWEHNWQKGLGAALSFSIEQKFSRLADCNYSFWSDYCDYSYWRHWTAASYVPRFAFLNGKATNVTRVRIEMNTTQEVGQEITLRNKLKTDYTTQDTNVKPCCKQNCTVNHQIIHESNQKMAFERTTGRSVNM